MHINILKRIVKMKNSIISQRRVSFRVIFPRPKETLIRNFPSQLFISLTVLQRFFLVQVQLFGGGCAKTV